MIDEELKKQVIQDVTLLKLVGFKPIIVHGGGKEISRWVEKTGMTPEFVNGLRKTDEPTMEIAEMVLNKVNKSLVQNVQSLGVNAVGVSGKDGGLLKVKKKLPYFIAVPTTAGTGSEASIASVVTNEETKDKFAISDGKLVPNVAILDDSLLKGLPSELVATTGMDAFTHAIESYINHAGNKKSKEYAKKSLYLIKNHLYEFYSDRENDIARHNMLYASFYAAISFTRSYVGYVHALAHAIGGVYHKPHGYLIAILLPYVLEAYGKKAYKALAKASIEMGIGSNTSSREENALSLISWIRELNQKMGIPNSLDNLINEKDYLPLAEHASIEANPWYPVPKELDKNELAFVLRKANSKNN
jgi:alcohol dehydrogenase class IV